jgi:hypothetical protein
MHFSNHCCPKYVVLTFSITDLYRYLWQILKIAGHISATLITWKSNSLIFIFS